MYYEATVTDEGLCRVGWAARDGALELGTDAGGFGFGGTGMASHAKRFEKYGTAFGEPPPPPPRGRQVLLIWMIPSSGGQAVVLCKAQAVNY